MRKLGEVAMAVMALTFAACTSSSTPPPASPTSSTRPSPTTVPSTGTVKPTVGVVTGHADDCAGLAPALDSRVRVLLYLGRTLVASKTVRSGATYRFSVAPGRYRVKVQPYLAHFVQAVWVRAGHSVTANFADICD